jgi:anthranilate synthase component 1
MIVDLMRNDLAKVCEVGSVAVPALCVLESYATVHQLVSTIEGQLRPGVGVWEVLTHCFPAGSMTGAPKKRAMEVLKAEESDLRGYYSGVYGIERVDGSATVAMTIRTAVVTPDSLSLGVGGGITALSVPGEEIREVGVKARAFFDALGVSSDDYS